jgi:stage III sporulation protein AA
MQRILKNTAVEKGQAASGLLAALSICPPRIRGRIMAQVRCRADFPDGLTEISLRTVGGCYITLSGEHISLRTSLEQSEAQAIYSKITEGVPFAHEETLNEGYVTIDGGVRVGVCGEVAYSGGVRRRVGTPTGFIFRIPSSHPSFSRELYGLWESSHRQGILVFSPPGGGKTTLIRALCGLVGGVAKCAVVDERREFIPDEYRGKCVDILRGYEKIKGIEIAKRTLCPEVIIIDELSGLAQIDALRACGRGGVSLIATVHAGSVEELYTLEGVKGLIEDGFFGILAELYRTGGDFHLRVHKSELYVV